MKIFVSVLIATAIFLLLSIIFEFLSNKASELRHNLLSSIFSFLYLVSLYTFVILFFISVVLFDFLLIG